MGRANRGTKRQATADSEPDVEKDPNRLAPWFFWPAVVLLVLYWAQFWTVQRAGAHVEAFGVTHFSVGRVPIPFWLLGLEQSSSPVWAAVFVVGTVVLFAYLAYKCDKLSRDERVHPKWIAALLVLTVIALITQFAYVYYTLGGSHRWSQQLTHVGAIYVATGMLTGGASGISPSTDSTRLLEVGQMAADLIVITVMAALVLHRITKERYAPSTNVRPS
ncbi:MAG TPA: hypothetical protein VN845_00625 [Solirubrobacteraceae bacterium]|nr:hypothetical protein [Solirubrobacteraceae bacterium]